MPCIRTGATVYLSQYGNATVHGDLFCVGDTYILACLQGTRACMSYHEPGKTIRANIVAYDYEMCGSGAIAFTILQASEFDYEGVPIEVT